MESWEGGVGEGSHRKERLKGSMVTRRVARQNVVVSKKRGRMEVHYFYCWRWDEPEAKKHTNTSKN